MDTSLLLTYSSATMHDWCPRRYYWRYERGLINAAKIPAVETGTLFHAGVAVLHDRGLSDKSLELALKATYPKKPTLKEELRAWKKNPPVPTEAAILARFLLERYASHYGNPDLPRFKSLGAEQTFRADLPAAEELAGTPVEFAGKIDWLVDDERGELWVVECKTAAIIDTEYLGKLPLDRQVTAYLIGAKVLLGREPNGVIYDVCGKPRTYRRAGEDYSMYLERAKLDYGMAPATFFARQRCVRDEQQSATYLESLCYKARLILEARNSGYWDMHTDACFLRNRQCPYTALCIEGETDRVLLGYERKAPHSELEQEDA